MYHAVILTADAIEITLDRIACNQLVTMRKTLSKIQQIQQATFLHKLLCPGVDRTQSQLV